MKAMILCAGKGTRVRPITYSVPKPMIPLVNRPIMSYILDHLKSHGVTEVVCNTSYRARDIENYFRDGADHGVAMSYSFEGYLDGDELQGIAVGSAGGMKLIQERSGFFDDTFVVLCGDAIVDIDLSALVGFHKQRGALATIATSPVPEDEISKYGIVVSDSAGRVSEFQEKPAAEDAKSNLANTGIYVFEPEIFDHIPAGQEYDIGGELLPDLIVQGLPFFSLGLSFEWIDVGAVEDFFTCTYQFLQGQYNSVGPKGRELAPGIWAASNVMVDGALEFVEGPVFLGAGCVIKPGAIIKGPSVIGANSVIEAGAIIERSIVQPHTRVRAGCHLREQAVVGDWLVECGTGSVELSQSKFSGLICDARAAAPVNEQSAPVTLVAG